MPAIATNAHSKSPDQKGMLMLSSHWEGQASAIIAIKAPAADTPKIVIAGGHHKYPAGCGTDAQRPVHAIIPATTAAANPAKLPSSVFAPRSIGVLRPPTKMRERSSFHVRFPNLIPQSAAIG